MKKTINIIGGLKLQYIWLAAIGLSIVIAVGGFFMDLNGAIGPVPASIIVPAYWLSVIVQMLCLLLLAITRFKPWWKLVLPAVIDIAVLLPLLG